MRQYVEYISWESVCASVGAFFCGTRLPCNMHTTEHKRRLQLDLMCGDDDTTLREISLISLRTAAKHHFYFLLFFACFVFLVSHFQSKWPMKLKHVTIYDRTACLNRNRQINFIFRLSVYCCFEPHVCVCIFNLFVHRIKCNKHPHV